MSGERVISLVLVICIHVCAKGRDEPSMAERLLKHSA